MRKIILGLLLPLIVAACGSAEPKWAPDNEVAHAVYRHAGPTSITLFTVISNGANSGAHSGLMINGSQRVLFDPAGTWYHPSIPERNDVHYGITERVRLFYIDYHTRITYRTVVQTIEVSPEVAEAALREVQAYGAVPKAMCSLSISTILSRLPGFEGMQTSYFPKKTMERFGELSGVTKTVIYDDDVDDNHGVLLRPVAAR